MSRRLVITADDVGLDLPAVRAVADLARAGRLTAVSIIPMAASATRALAQIGRVNGVASRDVPGGRPPVSIGLHATFTSDLAPGNWGPRSARASLKQPETGQFHSRVVDFAAVARPEDVLAELRAQIAWFRDAGVNPTHLDSHHGAIYGLAGPSFLRVALQACAENGLALRMPRRIPAEVWVSRTARLAHERAVAAADELGVALPETITTEWRPGDALAGYAELRHSYLTMLRRLPEGLSEIFLHPSPPPARGADIPPWLAKRVWEHRLLQDDEFSDTLSAEGIEVVSWPRLATTAEARQRWSVAPAR